MKKKLLYKFLLGVLFLPEILCMADFAYGSQKDFNDSDEYFVEVFLNERKLTDVMHIFYRDTVVYLPLAELRHILELPSEDFHTAQQAYKELKKNIPSLLPSELKVYNHILYVPLYAAQQDIKGKIIFDFELQNLLLFSSKDKFPIEERWLREERKKLFERRSGAAQIPSENVLKGQDFIQFPFLDISAGYFYNKDSSSVSDSNFGASAHAFGVTGNWDTEVFFQNMDYYNPASVNIKTSRYFEDERFLGVIKRIDAGDISVNASSASSGMASGRGLSLSSYSDDVYTDKKFNMREAVPLGWEVELYRGGELLGVSRPGVDGYFEFSDIILYQGQNKFDIIFYGPQGQIRKEERIFFYRGNLLNKGEAGFRAYAVDKNKNLTGTGSSYSDEFTGLSAMAGAAYGFTENITASAQFMAEPVTLYQNAAYKKEDKMFAAAGLSFMLNPVYISFESVGDFEENSASLDVVLQTELYGFNVNAENNYFNKIITNKNIMFDRVLENYTNLNLNKTLEIKKIFSLPFTLNYIHMKDTEGETQKEFYATAYQNLPGGIYMGAGYRNIDNFYGFKQSFLNAYLSKFFGRHSLRLEGDYNLDMDKLAAVNGTLTFFILKNLDGALRYNRSISDYERSRYFDRVSAGLNLRTAWGYFNIDVGMAEDDSRYLTAGYSLSLGYDRKNKKLLHSPDKIYDSGVIAARAYTDVNRNGVFDEGDKVLKKAPFYIQPSTGNRELEEAKNGYSYFPFLKKYAPFLVSVDLEDTDEGFSLMDSNAPVYARVRPGEIVYVDYPLEETGFADGYINFIHTDGSSAPIGGIRLILIDVKTGEKVSSVLSDYDGYYTFDKVPLGSYKILPDYKQMQALQYSFSGCREIHLNKPEESAECDLSVKKYNETRRTK
ncbi:hypothetical protein Dip510_001459 [Elusimicrobium posterum]|uniref:carboxypeptidase-like regulatory domain-containing protein n=1 Tax=Elusimicrobium posterum TaxID=3116653 RepID=UPI003C7667D9